MIKKKHENWNFETVPNTFERALFIITYHKFIIFNDYKARRKWYHRNKFANCLYNNQRTFSLLHTFTNFANAIFFCSLIDSSFYCWTNTGRGSPDTETSDQYRTTAVDWSRPTSRIKDKHCKFTALKREGIRTDLENKVRWFCDRFYL